MGFKSAALTAYNVAGTILGTWDPSYQNGTDASMSGEELARLVDLYNESLGINDILINKEGKRALFSQEGFDDYMGSRIADVGGFSAIIGSNGKSLREASQADRLNNCFTVTPETNEARKKFTEDMSNLLDYIEQKESSYRPKDLIDYLYNIKNDASNAIKAQQAQEIQRIEKLFSDDGFKALLKNDLSSNDDQLNKIKKEMLATLNKSHKEHLATFEKSMDEPLNKIHAAAQIERDRVAFLALIYKNDADAKKRINELYKNNQQPGNVVVSLETEGSVNKALFKGIKVTDLPMMKTITGRKMTTNPDGSFSMSLPNHWFTSSPGYYLDYNNNRKRDLMSIPLAIKACGFSSITMTITQTRNEDEAMETARDAYAACLEAGFEDKKITLEVNGKKVSAAELFASCPSRRQAAQLAAKDNEKRWEKSESLPSPTTKDFKDKVETFRRTHKEAASLTDDASTPSPTSRLE